MGKSNRESVIIARRINMFLNEYAPSQKTHSEHTLKSYDIAIALYLDFLETEKRVLPGTLSGASFSVTTIEEWLLWLMNTRGCSPATCNVRLASLRTFLSYLSKNEVSLVHLSVEATGIERKKHIRKKVEGMSKDAVKALLDAPDLSTKTGRRDLALLVLMYGTAARLNEVLSLQIKQLYLDAKKPYAIFIGKEDKIRTLYLLPKAVAHLKAYLCEVYGDTLNPEDYVFPARTNGKKLTQPAIDKRLKKYAVVAHKVCDEVPLKLHAHQIRHAKASHWLEDGMNIVQISFLLGHEQLETTMVYLDITTEQEAKALATLEDESDKRLPKKWKTNERGLASYCGIKPIKRKL